MPNQRRKDQKLLNLTATTRFIEQLNENLGNCGYSDRSKFIRDAIKEKLLTHGIEMDAGVHLAPQRIRPKSPVNSSPIDSTEREIEARARDRKRKGQK